jgi:hypothetical protein
VDVESCLANLHRIAFSASVVTPVVDRPTVAIDLRHHVPAGPRVVLAPAF